MKMFSFKLLTVSLLLHCTLSDPFLLLGIPQLNPSQIFKEEKPLFRYKLKPHPSIKSIEDLTNYIRSSNLEESEGLKIISNFLISDDPILKKEGSVFDLTGHDGLYITDSIPKGSKEVLEMRARSAAHLYFMKNYKEEYDPYGVDDISKDIVKNWKIFKVLLMGRNNLNEHMFLNVCISNDDMLPPLVSMESVKCEDKIKLVEDAKIKNEAFMKNLKTMNLFKSSNKQDNNTTVNTEKPIQAPSFKFIQNSSEMDKGSNINAQVTNSTLNSLIMKPIKSEVSTLSQQVIPPGNLRNQNDNLDNLNQRVIALDMRLNKLENKVEISEKREERVENDVTDLKTNLDKNFNKMNTILEKIALKLK